MSQQQDAPFSRVPDSEFGYNVKQVDAFLSRARATFNGGGNDDSVVTSHLIRRTTFAPQKGGYQAREVDGALDRLEGFVSLNGPAFYRLPPHEDRIRLVRRDEPVAHPAHIPAGDETVTVFDPGFPLFWHVEDAA